nr:methyl-CpG-binding domain protein 4 isoform X6 [Ziziphus jujuba var. spinosa]
MSKELITEKKRKKKDKGLVVSPYFSKGNEREKKKKNPIPKLPLSTCSNRVVVSPYFQKAEAPIGSDTVIVVAKKKKKNFVSGEDKDSTGKTNKRKKRSVSTKKETEKKKKKKRRPNDVVVGLEEKEPKIPQAKSCMSDGIFLKNKIKDILSRYRYKRPNHSVLTKKKEEEEEEEEEEKQKRRNQDEKAKKGKTHSKKSERIVSPYFQKEGKDVKKRKPRKTPEKATYFSASEKRNEAYRRKTHDNTWKPPRSKDDPLIQEDHAHDPWRVLVICMLLNKTNGLQRSIFQDVLLQTRKVISDLFTLCPNAKAATEVATEEIEKIIESLGLQNKRAVAIKRLSQEYLEESWTYVTQLHGVGK